MTFEQWLKRPVYVAQCHTWALASKLDLCNHQFRSLPGYRNAQAHQARRLVAEIVRHERKLRRGLLKPVLPASVDVPYWHWAFTGPNGAGAFGGTLKAQDVRHALVQVLTAQDGLQLFAETHGIPVEVIDQLPGNRAPLFEISGDWGRLTTVLAQPGIQGAA